MELSDKKVLVYGCGKSGIGAASLLLRSGACPVLYDENAEADKEKIAAETSEKSGCAFTPEGVIAGDYPAELTKGLDMVVLSPGIPTDIPLVKEFRAVGIPVIGEIELAYIVGKGKVYAITGTNGKTTSVTLLGEIMKAAFPEVYVVGNIGNPYTEIADVQTDNAVTVAEISSFQLETADTFHPVASAITNITEDHLNRHHTMEEYIRVKELITKNQTEDDLCVLNYDDEVLRAFGAGLKCRVCFFSSTQELDNGLFYKDGGIYEAADGKSSLLFDTGKIKILGLHNYENVMTAAAIALFAGVDKETLRRTVYDFKGVEHRIEYVGTYDGVSYYNDSKGTNPDASIKAVKAMKGSTLLIAGGYDKQSEYDELIENFGGRIRKLVLIGVTATKIAECAKRHGFRDEDIEMCGTLDRAVEYCRKEAQSGESVLLSPACASWDQFGNFEERGDAFKKLVCEPV